LEITHGNRLSLFLPELTFYETNNPTRLTTTHSTQQQKRDLKHYDHGASRQLFPVHLALNYTLVLKYAKK
jgi:hypothetical protein